MKMEIQPEAAQQPMKWYSDGKLLTGVIIVILSFAAGVYGKALILFRFYEPVQLLTGISIYAFSFVLLFLGAFLVGWRTIKIIRARINYHVKKTVRRSYDNARKFPEQATAYTKRLHRKSIDKISEASRKISKKIGEQNG